jgi:isocitrate dehydrogenase kinase/phosphatase
MYHIFTVRRHLWLQAEIEKVVKEACNYLPASVEGQCREFVDTYGNAVIALLAQEIDPSQVSCLDYRQTVHFKIVEAQKKHCIQNVDVRDVHQTRMAIEG